MKNKKQILALISLVVVVGLIATIGMDNSLYDDVSDYTQKEPMPYEENVSGWKLAPSAGENNDGYVEQGDGSEIYAEPAAKLEQKYEDAMAESDLTPLEKEQIRSIVEKEGKSFAEALGITRPGYKVTETQVETPAPAPAPAKPVTKPTAPTTPPKTNEGASGGANFNNGDNRTEAQKEADEIASDPFNDPNFGGPSQDISHEFGLGGFQ